MTPQPKVTPMKQASLQQSQIWQTAKHIFQPYDKADVGFNVGVDKRQELGWQRLQLIWLT